MTTPMTAAEFAGPSWSDSVFARRVLAALEEREALLGRVAVLTDERDRARTEAAEVRRLCEADAVEGALVRRIREHPMYGGAFETRILCGCDSVLIRPVSKRGLESALRFLDSLLPKEPEVAPSGWTYEPAPEYGSRCWRRTGTAGRFSSERDIQVPPIDREFVAKLLGGKDD